MSSAHQPLSAIARPLRDLRSGWTDAALTSLTAPGVSAMMPSVQAFLGCTAYCPPQTPGIRFIFVACPWPPAEQSQLFRCGRGPVLASGMTGQVSSGWNLKGNPSVHRLSLHVTAWPSGVLKTTCSENTMLLVTCLLSGCVGSLPGSQGGVSRRPTERGAQGRRSPGQRDLWDLCVGGAVGRARRAAPAPAGVSQPLCGAEAVWEPQGAGGDAGCGGRAAEDRPPGVPGHQGEWAAG